MYVQWDSHSATLQQGCRVTNLMMMIIIIQKLQDITDMGWQLKSEYDDCIKVLNAKLREQDSLINHYQPIKGSDCGIDAGTQGFHYRSSSILWWLFTSHEWLYQVSLSIQGHEFAYMQQCYNCFQWEGGDKEKSGCFEMERVLDPE